MLGNIRPRFRYRKMQILWSFTLLWNCWGEGLVARPSTQMYCAMTNGHCMLCLRHYTRPRPRSKKSMTGGGGGWGAINRDASPAASLSDAEFRVRKPKPIFVCCHGLPHCKKKDKIFIPKG